MFFIARIDVDGGRRSAEPLCGAELSARFVFAVDAPADDYAFPFGIADVSAVNRSGGVDGEEEIGTCADRLEASVCDVLFSGFRQSLGIGFPGCSGVFADAQFGHVEDSEKRIAFCACLLDFLRRGFLKSFPGLAVVVAAVESRLTGLAVGGAFRSNRGGAGVNASGYGEVVADIGEEMILEPGVFPFFPVFGSPENAVAVGRSDQFIRVERVAVEEDSRPAPVTVSVKMKILHNRADGFSSIAADVNVSFEVPAVPRDVDDAVRVARVDGKRARIHAAVAFVDGIDLVKRTPAVSRIVAAVGTADVNVGVPDVRVGFGNFDVLDISSAPDRKLLPLRLFRESSEDSAEKCANQHAFSG